MKQKSVKVDNNWSKPLQQRVREGFLLISIAISLYLLLSLSSYQLSDPGWASSGMSDGVLNTGGRAGAWFADCFLTLFGYLAFLFPFVMGYLAWLIFRECGLPKAHIYLLLLRFSGFILVLFAGTGLASLLITQHLWHLPLSAGGILGSYIGPGLAGTFNPQGTTLILSAFLLVGCTWLTGISWLKVAKLLANIILQSRHILSSLSRVIAQKACSLKQYIKLPERKPGKAVAVVESAKPVLPAIELNRDVIDVEPVVVEDATGYIEPVISKPAKQRPRTPSFTPAKQKGLPALDLLEQNLLVNVSNYTTEFLKERSKEVELRLKDFGVDARVVAVHPGPVITRYEIALAPGIKVSKISGLAKDLARSLSMVSVRIVDVIPGKSVIGIELPNETRETVRLREVLESPEYAKAKSPLSLALGKDIAGNPVIVNLAKMPHLLVAGTTGSGKSVGVNAMLLSILFKSTPEQVRMILVDPKMLELSIYDDIPHLLTPVVTDMKEAANALRWCVAEMERRYRLMAALGVRNLEGYNKKVQAAIDKGEPIPNPLIPKIPNEPEQEIESLETLPSIVVIVDEFADMMMVVGKKVEQLIARIAQKARAAGIHLMLATQRPSVDVITGLIKANIPTRISFQVSSKVDSRTILDQMGAEQLLGQGDMLYLPPGTGVPVRVHGAFVADEEVHNVVNELKAMGEPAYLDEVLNGGGDLSTNEAAHLGEGEGGADYDELFDEAVMFVTKQRRASISGVQRKFRIGYNRAARIIEQMETSGIVSSMDQSGNREVLANAPPE